MLVIRCTGPNSFFVERVISSAEVLVLLVPDKSKVEVWGDELYGPRLDQRFRVTSQSLDPFILD